MTADAQPALDEAFVADRIEDAIDRGTVDDRARDQLLAALGELDRERAAERRTAGDGCPGH